MNLLVFKRVIVIVVVATESGLTDDLLGALGALDSSVSRGRSTWWSGRLKQLVDLVGRDAVNAWDGLDDDVARRRDDGRRRAAAEALALRWWCRCPGPVWKSKFYGAFVLNHRAVLHAIDATPARWRGDAGSSPLDRARRAASSPRMT